MRKTPILIVIGLTSLVIMACGFAGLAQQNIEELPSHTVAVKEFPAAAEQSLAEEIESTIQIEHTPTPTIDPIRAAKSCLANTWEINDLSDYVIAAVPLNLAEQYDLQYEDTSGQAYFMLSPDGQIILHAENLEFLFTARVSIFQVPVTVRIDGTAVGNYDVDSTTLTTSDMDTSDLTASAQVLNEDLIDPAQIINAFPFISPPFNTAKYSCQGDILELELSAYPGNIPPLVFQAVE